MGKGLDNVKGIYLEGIMQGKAREAVTKYTGHRYTQHSTGVANGVEGFLAFFEPFVERNPKREIEIVRIFEDGPWVFCQAYQSLNDGAARWVTMDMFFTDKDGLILEHWDTIAPYVEVTKSGEDMVGGVSQVDLSADTETNKAIVREFTKQVRQEGDPSKITQFMAENLIQHSDVIDAGSSGFKAWHVSPDCGDYEMLFNLIGQGDFVMTYGKRHAQGKDIAVFDLFRLEDQMIVEHWMNQEEISPREAWGNSGKF